MAQSKFNNPEFVQQSKGQVKVLTHGHSYDCKVHGNGTQLNSTQTNTSSANNFFKWFIKVSHPVSINSANYAQLHSDHSFLGFLASVFVTCSTNTQ